LPVQHVAERAWVPVMELARTRKVNTRAVTQVNRFGLDRNTKVASPPD